MENVKVKLRFGSNVNTKARGVMKGKEGKQKARKVE